MLEEDQAFDLRIWSEQEEKNNQPKRGAVAPTQDLEVEVELQYVPAIKDYGPGFYYWTVVVVQVSSDAPPKIVGEWGEKRWFTINGAPGPRPTLEPTPTRIQP